MGFFFKFSRMCRGGGWGDVTAPLSRVPGARPALIQHSWCIMGGTRNRRATVAQGSAGAQPKMQGDRLAALTKMADFLVIVPAISGLIAQLVRAYGQ